MSEQQPERPRLNDAQEKALGSLCARYGVDYSPDDYYVYPADASMMAGYAEGWVGGEHHANPDYARPAEPAGKPTIFVGCSALGEVHS